MEVKSARVQPPSKKGVHWDSSNFMIRINPPISYSRSYQLYPSGLSYDPYKWKYCINFQHACGATYWANGSTSSKQVPIINTNWRYRFSLARCKYETSSALDKSWQNCCFNNFFLSLTQQTSCSEIKTRKLLSAIDSNNIISAYSSQEEGVSHLTLSRAWIRWGFEPSRHSVSYARSKQLPNKWCLSINIYWKWQKRKKTT